MSGLVFIEKEKTLRKKNPSVPALSRNAVTTDVGHPCEYRYFDGKKHMTVYMRIIEVNRNRAEKSSRCRTVFYFLFNIVFQCSVFILVYLAPSFLFFFFLFL
jgi:hypothetical protein